jgi:hypothetical protein
MALRREGPVPLSPGLTEDPRQRASALIKPLPSAGDGDEISGHIQYRSGLAASIAREKKN